MLQNINSGLRFQVGSRGRKDAQRWTTSRGLSVCVAASRARFEMGRNDTFMLCTMSGNARQVEYTLNSNSYVYKNTSE
jgi:hypothetical protein